MSATKSSSWKKKITGSGSPKTERKRLLEGEDDDFNFDVAAAANRLKRQCLSKKQRSTFEDDFDADLSSDIKGLTNVLHQSKVKAQKDGQKKNEETISSKSVFHPYNTRTRGYHNNSTRPILPAPPSQLKESTSLPKRSNEVVNDTPPSGESANVIPKVLYSHIQKALSYRKHWEAKKDAFSEAELKSSEAVVRTFVRLYKNENFLPHDWTYDPATASTLVPDEGDAPLRLFDICRRKRCVDDEWIMNKVRNKPLIYNVGLKNNELQSWSQFKEFAEKNCAHVMESSNARIPLDVSHPFVILTGNFAVVGFNEAYEMYIKKGECNRIGDHVLKEFTYCKGHSLGATKVGDKLCWVDGGYHFYMLIEAVEDGIRGIYRAEVRCLLDGRRTLLRFSLIDGTNVDESFEDAYFRMEPERVEDALPYDSGMNLLKTAMGSVRYDYFNPEEEDF